MTLRLIARPSGILVPRKDFGLQGAPSGDLVFGEDIGYVASLLLGFDGNEPRLLQLDANKSLKVTMAGQAATGAQQIDLGTNLPNVWRQASGFADTTGGSLLGSVGPWIFNGALWDRLRSASAANLVAQSGQGTALASPPGEWSVTSAPAAGVQASAVRAAGAAGVRHVCKGFGFAAGSVVAPVLTPLLVNVRDGASGAGTILKSIVVIIAAAVGQNVPPIEVTGLNLVGTAATAMTVEFSAALANLSQSVSLSGFDAA